ncbi:MAG: molybdopterin-dependent oxidoreductase [Gammaproteobacteria bacterium]|jgi:dimethylsulfide dehydrogenase subunit alpha/complex iron-sulfur molybdoenzyme family reductase subunit alpha|nr:molybdopterin-dependent oxidoreductase [Chromatiaceae bacterium]MCU0935390.1 molybdopterin-dependent oxidoreductase [Gammaproteobacteria bacterium]
MERREFLKGTAYCGLALAFGGPLTSLRAQETPAVANRSWEDLYRRELADILGDAMGFAFHCSNCQGNCAWKVYARDGRVTREEQSAAYPQIHPRIPDANPRGCNKGIVHSKQMVQADRLLYPMKRAGGRGQGRWERVTWEAAIADIAARVVDSLQGQGLASLMVYCGTGILSQGRRAGPLRLGSLLGAQRLYPASAVGDMFTGASLAYGLATVGHSLDAWFEAKTILLWGINAAVTRIPDAHYLAEARYNGARIYCITPEYNATAKLASHWVPVKAGTDSFLALSLLHVLFRDGLIDADFVREQTDLPFLVRTDTGDLLRHRDLRDKGKDDVFYGWDQASGSAQPMPGTQGHFKKSLRLGRLRPALEGNWEVKGKDGAPIPVTTVFERARSEALRFPPEATQAITGVHPELVERMAQDLARVDKAIVNIGFSLHKYVSGTMTCWAAALACALTGHAGERGGLDTENNWSLGGIGPLASPKPARFASGFFSEWMNGDMVETMRRHYSDAHLQATLGLGHAELEALAEGYAETSEAWFSKPRALLLFADNMLQRNKSQAHYRRAFIEGLDLFVDVNHRMDSTALWADYVLPAKSQYESWDLRGELGYHRFCNITVPPPGLRPIGETKSEWEICRLLAQAIAREAERRGLGAIPDPDFLETRDDKAAPVMRDLARLAEDFTDHGQLMDDEAVVRWLMAHVPAIAPWTPEDAMKHGFVTLNREAGFTSPLYANRPFHSFEHNVYLRQPYATLSGRQQFYVDHPLYKRLGATTPTAMAPVRPAGFPLAFFTPHTRHGIHSQWRANAELLRLQRGEPYVWLNPETARVRGIGEGDAVRVFNDVGDFQARAKLMPAIPPDALVMDHAWEPFQFRDRLGLNNPVAGLLSPLELVTGWGHMSFSPNWDGNMLAFESSVEVEKVREAAA